jgi:hypothetical protein
VFAIRSERPFTPPRSRASACDPHGAQKRASTSHGVPTGAAAAFMMRPTTGTIGEHVEIVIRSIRRMGEKLRRA